MRYLLLLSILTLTTLVGCSTGLLTGGDRYEQQPRTEGVATADAAITQRIKRRVADDAMLSQYRIGVTTYKGRVTLTGSVPSYKERNRAGEIAKAESGARTINNQIVAGSESDPR